MGSTGNRGAAEAGGDLLSFMRAVASLHRSLLAVGDSIAGAAGQTRARSECLQQIGEQPRTVASIAAQLNMTRQSVQRVADLLVDDELATYENNPRHRRAKLLVPTAAGHRALITMREAHQEWTRHAAAKLETVALNEVTGQLLDILAVVNGSTSPGAKLPAEPSCSECPPAEPGQAGDMAAGQAPSRTSPRSGGPPEPQRPAQPSATVRFDR